MALRGGGRERATMPFVWHGDGGGRHFRILNRPPLASCEIGRLACLWSESPFIMPLHYLCFDPTLQPGSQNAVPYLGKADLGPSCCRDKL